MTNPTFPWPMDKAVEQIESYSSYEQAKGRIPSWTHFDYLLTRLKLAEGERDELKAAYRSIT